jgi:hypothetical protein
MIYRLTLAVVAAVFFGIAQSASAALTPPDRPMVPEFEATSEPSASTGTDTAPDVPAETPASTEQGVSSSPGVTPVADPSDPVQPEPTDGEGDEDDGDDEPEPSRCGDAVRDTETAKDWLRGSYMVWNVFAGTIADRYFHEQTEFLYEVVKDLEQAEETPGCHGSPEGETAE